jgi:hypothetical protein
MILTRNLNSRQRSKTAFDAYMLIIKEFELGLNLGKVPTRAEYKKINKQVSQIVKELSNT